MFRVSIMLDFRSILGNRKQLDEDFRIAKVMDFCVLILDNEFFRQSGHGIVSAHSL